MKTMPNSTQEEKYRWIKPILEGAITIKDMAKVCPFSERALKYWLAAYRKYSREGLQNRSARPKTHPLRKGELVEIDVKYVPEWSITTPNTVA